MRHIAKVYSREQVSRARVIGELIEEGDIAKSSRVIPLYRETNNENEERANNLEGLIRRC